MKFNSFYDFCKFKELTGRAGLTDEVKLRLDACDSQVIPDDLFYLLTDSVDSYLGEMKERSGSKPFMKTLRDCEKLNTGHIPALASFVTHAALGLQSRSESRKIVDQTGFQELRRTANRMIDEILKTGECRNELRAVLIQ